MNRLTLFSVFLLCTAAPLTRADDSIEVGSGYEYQPGRSGHRMRLKVDLLNFKDLLPSTGFAFLPLTTELSPGDYRDASFGQVQDSEKYDGTDVRRVTGVLIQSVTDPLKKKDRLYVRSKLLAIDLDRDRGIVGWNILDAAVSLTAYRARIGNTVTLRFELSGGMGFGFSSLKGFSQLKEDLGLRNQEQLFALFTPHAEARLSASTTNVRIEISRGYLKRMGFEGAAEARSQERTTQLRADYRVMKRKAGEIALYASAEELRDTLTLGSAFFGRDDRFQSMSLFTGIRFQK